MRKSTGVRYTELLNSMFIVKDCLELIKSGKDYHISTISVQLRGTFLDSEGDNEPLFFEVMKNLGLVPNLYIIPEERFQKISEGSLFYFHIHYPTLSPTGENTKMIRLKDWFELPILKKDKREVSAKQLIKIISDRFGGAHYDPKVSQWEHELRNMRFYEMKVIDNAIIRLSELLLYLVWEGVRCKSNFYYGIEFSLIFDKITKKQNIVAFKEGHSYISVHFELQKNNSLTVKLVGPFEKSFEVVILDEISSNDLISVGINYYINPSFSYCLEIFSKGELVKKMEMPFPLFIVNTLFQYNSIEYGDDELCLELINEAQYLNILNIQGAKNIYEMFVEGRKNMTIFPCRNKLIKVEGDNGREYENFCQTVDFCSSDIK